MSTLKTQKVAVQEMAKDIVKDEDNVRAISKSPYFSSLFENNPDNISEIFGNVAGNEIAKEQPQTVVPSQTQTGHELKL